MVATRAPARCLRVGWVFAWIIFVLIEAFNPKPMGMVKALGRYRQQLQWVPFFWFGYLLIRTPLRFKRAFWLLGVIALLNALASTGQTQAVAWRRASLGSGYSPRVNGAARDIRLAEAAKATCVRSGWARDSGLQRRHRHGRPARGCSRSSRSPAGARNVGGPDPDARLAGRRHHRARAIAGRGTVIALGAFVGYSLIAGRRISKPLAGGQRGSRSRCRSAVVRRSVGSGVFSRYTSDPARKVTGTALAKDRRGRSDPEIHRRLAVRLRAGHGRRGVRLRREAKELFEGTTSPRRPQYNLLIKELGMFGLAIWLGFLIRLFVLPATHLRKVRTPNCRSCWSRSPPRSWPASSWPSTAPSRAAWRWPVLYFAAGVMGYWFLGGGRSGLARRDGGGSWSRDEGHAEVERRGRDSPAKMGARLEPAARRTAQPRGRARVCSVASGFAEAALLAVIAQIAVTIAGGKNHTNRRSGFHLHGSDQPPARGGIRLAVLRLLMQFPLSHLPAQIAGDVQSSSRKRLFLAFTMASWACSHPTARASCRRRCPARWCRRRAARCRRRR